MIIMAITCRDRDNDYDDGRMAILHFYFSCLSYIYYHVFQRCHPLIPWFLLFFILIVSILILSINPVYADTITQTMDGSMDITVTWPDNVIAGRSFTVSIFVQNNGWEDKKDVTFIFDTSNDAIIPETNNRLILPQVTKGSSFGQTINFRVEPDASSGSYFLNMNYSQVLLVNSDERQTRPTRTNIAIPITVQEQPRVNIHTITPQSIFANADFPFMVEIISYDEDIHDVELQIIPTKDIEFRGETLHTFSMIKKGEPVTITSRIATPSQEIEKEYKIPFQIYVEYTDRTDKEIMDSSTISITMRPRTFMELTTDGGIWIGNFFIAPYISIGTLVGIPTGIILSVLIRKRSQKFNEKEK